MEGDKHFSHDHPLTSFIYKEVDDYLKDEKVYLCNICGLPILSSTSYTCSIMGCNFFLHKPCARLPEELYHPCHDPDHLKHTLHLNPKSPPSQYFTYQCDKCEFELHPFVAKPLEIKTNHRSHLLHPLVVICREISSQCDACGEKQDGFFFCCQKCKKCNFWIHQDCTLLKSVVKLRSHSHPSILTYSLPSYIRHKQCVICNRRMHLTYSGLYFCGECDSYAHVNCAKSSMENLRTEITRPELIQLPDEGDKFPSLVIRSYLERNLITQHDVDEKCHGHPLIFDDGSNISREASCNLVCHLCIQPINIPSPFYRCLNCHFLAHDICADHLCRVKYPLGENYSATVCPNPNDLVFNSVFPCLYCHRPSNGLCHYCGGDNPLGLFFMDPECLLAPDTIKHASHKQHVLFLAIRLEPSDITNPLRCCSGAYSYGDIYRCIVCDFYIHMRCALLPKRTRHKFDEHPVELIMCTHQNKSINEEQECCFCEFCEQDINRQYWYYGCGKCEHYFHINCIPSVGYLSKVKSEKTLVDNNIHPLLEN